MHKNIQQQQPLKLHPCCSARSMRASNCKVIIRASACTKTFKAPLKHHVIRCIIIHMHIQELALAPESCFIPPSLLGCGGRPFPKSSCLLFKFLHCIDDSLNSSALATTPFSAVFDTKFDICKVLLVFACYHIGNCLFATKSARTRWSAIPKMQLFEYAFEGTSATMLLRLSCTAFECMSRLP